ncbi:MAG: hypothetical protein U9N55_05825, partial [candidate division Zixibacteria bacterium]|nr:hypothetical protein [candidate division Zixibacteria bacterium]
MQKIVITYTAVGLLILLLLLAFSNEIQAADESFFVKLDKENCITKLNVTTKQTQIIYHSDKWRTHNITVSPNNRYIAFIEETKFECTRDGLYKVAPQRSLVIIDSSGKVDRRIDDIDVKKYVWSPDGEKIAFLTFKPCDCDYKYKYPTGAWVYDMNTSEVIKIKDRARGINWAVFDSAVYLYSRDRDGEQVVRWDPVSQRLDSTVYKDIYF